VAEAAAKLGVSRASFYNYLAKKDLPRPEVLRRAHRLWRLNFSYGTYPLDDQYFDRLSTEPGPVKEIQIPLPFIESLRNEDIVVLKVSPRKPNAVEVKLLITFAG